jgi:predicted molibdopterin-dependent oxidoreductase YjgC
MASTKTILINGRRVPVAEGTTVAAALMMADEASRHSVSGELRAPLCGMGVCMECRARVNGVLHRRTCQLPCEDGMEVVTE